MEALADFLGLVFGLWLVSILTAEGLIWIRIRAYRRRNPDVLPRPRLADIEHVTIQRDEYAITFAVLAGVVGVLAGRNPVVGGFVLAGAVAVGISIARGVPLPRAMPKASSTRGGRFTS